jgi:hypothetical protein
MLLKKTTSLTDLHWDDEIIGPLRNQQHLPLATHGKIEYNSGDSVGENSYKPSLAQTPVDLSDMDLQTCRGEMASLFPHLRIQTVEVTKTT